MKDLMSCGDTYGGSKEICEMSFPPAYKENSRKSSKSKRRLLTLSSP